MPAHREETHPAKNVVYLWGAGATQAEITYLGAHRINLLMRDSEQLGEGIATRILGQLTEPSRSSFMTDSGTDIEKLISLLTACNVASYSTLAETLRQLYFEDIRANLTTAQLLPNPQLAIALLELHNNAVFRQNEELRGIITTNHDGLLQVASQKVYGEVNIGIPFRSDTLTPYQNQRPPLLHLHGSFTWTFGLPLNVTLLSESAVYSSDTVWIPPTILKESKSYPFNKLAGLAYELLSKRCDVLRIVGSALTQNDWHVLSMIFNAQRHKELTGGAPFRIELIMSQDGGVAVAKDCAYLKNLTPIGFLTDGDFASYKEDDRDSFTEEMKNPFFYWLKQKITFHRGRGHLGAPPLQETLARIAGDIP